MGDVKALECTALTSESGHGMDAAFYAMRSHVERNASVFSKVESLMSEHNVSRAVIGNLIIQPSRFECGLCRKPNARPGHECKSASCSYCGADLESGESHEKTCLVAHGQIEITEEMVDRFIARVRYLMLPSTAASRRKWCSAMTQAEFDRVKEQAKNDPEAVAFFRDVFPRCDERSLPKRQMET